MARHYDDASMTVNQALESFNVDKLKLLGKLLDVPGQLKRKGELVSFIEKQLTGRTLISIWKRLDDIQKAALSEAVHSWNGAFYPENFEAKYGKIPDWGTLDRYRSRRENKSPTLLRLFFYQNLIPYPLLLELKSIVPLPPKPKIQVLTEIPSKTPDHTLVQQRDTSVAAAHELRGILRLIQSRKVAVSDKTRLPSSSTEKMTSSILYLGDFYDDSKNDRNKRGTKNHLFHSDQQIGQIKSFAWFLLVQAAGLAQLSGTRLQLTKSGNQALADPPHETLKNLWEKWQNTPLFDEFRRIDTIKGQTGKSKRGFTAVPHRRMAISKALSQCPTGAWVSVDEFFRYMRAAGFDFEVIQDAWGLYISDPHYGSLGYEGYGDWKLLQARYALCVLFEYVATLGMIDIAYIHPAQARPDYGDQWGTDDLEFLSRYDGLLYFRLNSLGAYCLDITQSYTPPPLELKPILKILPNFELVAHSETPSPIDQMTLELYTEKKSDLVWFLSRSKLLTAIESGHSIADFRGFLKCRSTEPIPTAIDEFLKDIEDRTTQFSDCGSARLIECASEALTALVVNDTGMRKIGVLPGGKNHIVIPTAGENEFKRNLKKLGYTLTASDKKQKSAQNHAISPK